MVSGYVDGESGQITLARRQKVVGTGKGCFLVKFLSKCIVLWHLKSKYELCQAKMVLRVWNAIIH